MESERMQLLRSIADKPDDDFPRLVMADWLEEHSEPEHAELIRIQIELKKVTLPKPTKWGSPEYYRFILKQWELCKHIDPKCKPLLEREKELLLHLGMLEVYSCGYDRGFIVNLQTHSRALLNDHFNLLSRHPIHTIRLTDWKGVKESLPPNPHESLPFLARLELPASAFLGHLALHPGETFSRRVAIGWEQIHNPANAEGPIYVGLETDAIQQDLPDVSLAWYNDLHS